jgi:hypothetical protein
MHANVCILLIEKKLGQICQNYDVIIFLQMGSYDSDYIIW